MTAYRGIYAMQTDALAVDLERVAVDDAGRVGDVGGLNDLGEKQQYSEAEPD